MNTNNLKIDSPLLIIVILLLVLGMVMVYSASSFKAQEFHKDSHYFIKHHLYKVVLGFVVLLLVTKLDYHLWLKISPLLLFVGLCFLVYLLVGPDVPRIRGSKRWIIIWNVQFQPSDFARLALILFLSSSLGKRDALINTFDKRLILDLFIIGFMTTLILLQPDVGAAGLIIFIAATLLFLAGVKLRYLYTLGLASLPFFIFHILKEGYQKERLFRYLASLKGEDVVWQTQQSLIALGNGGLFGVGLGSGRQKYHFLPDPFTDFIFAIVGEELGLIGTTAVLVLFMLIIWRGFKIALKAPDAEGRLLASGIVLNIGFYAIANAAVVVNLLPTTGIPMPFISYGGSALLANLVGIGILLNISAQIWHKRRLYPVPHYKYRRTYSNRYGFTRNY
ncbi:MAG: putative lipid II flippase FtsW [bacterium]